MANIIKLKRGKSTDISKLTLQTGEIALTTDTNAILSMNSQGIIENITPKYTLTKSGSTITLSGTDGSSTSVSDSNTTYSAATTSANGLMSKEDKAKLNGIAANANNYSLPTASASTLGGIKIGANLTISNGVLNGLDPGGCEVYVGTTAPTDPTVKVWINPEEEGTGINGFATTEYVNNAIENAIGSALGGSY